MTRYCPSSGYWLSPSAAPDVREEASTQLIGNASMAMRMLLQDRPRARVIVYRVRSKKGQKRRLEAVNFVGRKDKPGAFIDGTKRGPRLCLARRRRANTARRRRLRAPTRGLAGHPPRLQNLHLRRRVKVRDASASTHQMSVILLETDVVVVDLVASLLGLGFAQADRKP